MKTLPLSEAKAKLSQLVESINVLDDEVMITKNGRVAAVLVSPAEWESLNETRAIVNDSDFLREIRQSLKRFKSKTQLYSLQDLFKD